MCCENIFEFEKKKNQEKQGCWKLIYNGTSLEAKFNGECHKLMYVACELKAIARNRTGTVAMWIQGDRGESPDDPSNIVFLTINQEISRHNSYAVISWNTCTCSKNVCYKVSHIVRIQ